MKPILLLALTLLLAACTTTETHKHNGNKIEALQIERVSEKTIQRLDLISALVQ